MDAAESRSARYPGSTPYGQGWLEVGEGHSIYWEVCGRPDGKPGVVLHGGPGSGADSTWTELFNPAVYRVVLFDQRGCGRSKPTAAGTVDALNANTTRHLIADIESLRTYLAIDRWLVLGASWGSVLGLAYAQTHPRSVSEAGSILGRRGHAAQGRLGHSGNGSVLPRGVEALSGRRSG
jgi:proline iminopeptidase